MFEQTFVEAKTAGDKRYTVVGGLAIEVTGLMAVALLPLIYTQVLPRAELRGVLAAPAAPRAEVPRVVAKVLRTAAVTNTLNLTRAVLDLRPVTTATNPALAEAAPDIVIGAPEGDPPSVIGASNAMAERMQPPPAPQPAAAPKRVRVTHVAESQLIFKVQPAYPQIARTTHVQGSVEFTAVIGKTGMIDNLQLVHGHPLLVNAARSAILQWRYKPTLLNGEPVEVVTDIVVNFVLGQ